jgi:hypothetical protein
MKMSEKLKVGQKLWWVGNYRNRTGVEVTVTKVGRVWAELSNRERISIKTLQADEKGYSSPGSCYLSSDEHKRIIERQKAWDLFRKNIHYRHIPDHVTVEDITEAARLIGIENFNSQNDK